MILLCQLHLCMRNWWNNSDPVPSWTVWIIGIHSCQFYVEWGASRKDDSIAEELLSWGCFVILAGGMAVDMSIIFDMTKWCFCFSFEFVTFPSQMVKALKYWHYSYLYVEENGQRTKTVLWGENQSKIDSSYLPENPIFPIRWNVNCWTSP